jgi:HK97 family phage prohead protease
MLKKIFAKGFVREIKENGTIIGAVASTGSLDREGEVLEPYGWRLDNFRKAPRLLWSHMAHELPIGKVTKIAVEVGSGALIFDAEFAEKENDFAKKVADLVRGGFLNTFSVGFMPLNQDGNRYLEQELLEISVVNIPANAEARLSLAFKSFEKEVEQMFKGVIPYKKHPLAEEGTEWDAGAEVRNAEVADLKEMCAWFDSDNPDVKGSYKLPHHTTSGYKTVWRGVAAAMGALLGARGGVDIPDADKKGVYNHLAGHYKDFEKEPPEFKEMTEEEIGQMLESYGMKPAPEVTENYIRIRVENPDKFVNDSFRTITISAAQGIKAIIGKYKTDPNGPTHVQSYLFDKDKWTVAEAQTWVEEHSKEYDFDMSDMTEIIDIIEIRKLVAQIKEGRVISEKNRALIRACIDSMKQSIEALEELMAQTEPPAKGADEKTKVDGKAIKRKKILRALQLVDKTTEFAIHELKSGK